MEHTVEIEVTREDQVKRYVFVVEEATVMHTITRSVYRSEGEQYVKALSENAEDGTESTRLRALSVVAMAMYPDLKALTKSATIITYNGDGEVVSEEPFTYGVAEFIGLSDVITTPWSDLAYDTNPHWLPVFEKEDAGKEKKNGNE